MTLPGITRHIEVSDFAQTLISSSRHGPRRMLPILRGVLTVFIHEEFEQGLDDIK